MTTQLSRHTEYMAEIARRSEAQAAYYAAHPACPTCGGSGMEDADFAYVDCGDGIVNGELLDWTTCRDCLGRGTADGAPRWTPAMMEVPA